MIDPVAIREFAAAMQRNKPYLLEIEGEAQRIQHGEVTVRLEIRNGNVEKMQFIDAKRTWLRDKSEAKPVVIMNIVQSL